MSKMRKPFAAKSCEAGKEIVAELAEVLQQVAVVARHLDHVASHAEAEVGRHPLGIALGMAASNIASLPRGQATGMMGLRGEAWP